MDFRRLTPDDRWIYTYKCKKCGFQNEYIIELPPHMRQCAKDIHLWRYRRCDGQVEFVSVRPDDGNKSEKLPELKYEGIKKEQKMTRKLGNYKARAIGAQLGVAGTGTEQICVTFEITAEGSRKGEQHAWYGFFTDATTQRTLDALEYAGWDGDSLEKPVGLGRIECEIVLAEEEDLNGEPRIRVQWVNKPGGGGMKNVMSPAEAKSFNERMRGEIAARKAERAQRQNTGDSDFNYGANANVPDKPPV